MGKATKPRTWFVIRTQHGVEKRVADDLKAAGVAVYLPVEKRLRRRRQARVELRTEITLPLLPRYMFVQLPDDETYHAVKGVAGVDGFLGRQGDGKPLAADDGDVTRLRVCESKGDFDYTPRKLEFAKDQPVRIVRGPFTGYKAKFLSRRADERIQVLMQALVRGAGEWPVVLDIHDLEAVA